MFCDSFSSDIEESGTVGNKCQGSSTTARTTLRWNELNVGDVVMVNYNVKVLVIEDFGLMQKSLHWRQSQGPKNFVWLFSWGKILFTYAV